MERTDDLDLEGLRLIQNTDLFCFGTDSVLLSDFARIRPGSIVIDLCTGNGIIPVLLSAKTKAKKIYGIEIQRQSWELAVRNAELNGIEDRLEFINDDVKNWKTHFSAGSADVITCNPPYMKAKSGFKSPEDARAAARHELFIDFDGIARCASRLLKFGGHFFTVHRADRLCDVLCSLRANGIEPKRIAFVSPSPERAANLILVEAMRGAKPSLKLEKPIYANIQR